MFSKEFTAELGLDICKDVFILIHKHGLSDEETLAITAMLFALASRAVGMPERGAREMLKGTFKMIDDLRKERGI